MSHCLPRIIWLLNYVSSSRLKNAQKQRGLDCLQRE